MAAFAPIPNASVRMTVIARPGACARERAATLSSLKKLMATSERSELTIERHAGIPRRTLAVALSV
jgi:hypothetical protein